jgi:hypothetical protein
MMKNANSLSALTHDCHNRGLAGADHDAGRAESATMRSV